MRIDIVENSSQRLHLALRVRLPVYLVAALVFIGLGLWCIKLLGVESRITVADGKFAYTKACLWVLECEALHVAAADVHDVETVLHERGPWRSLEVQVRVRDQTHRLALPASDGDGKAVLASDIRAALARPGTSFRHQEGMPALGLALGLTCIAGGLVILSAVQWVSVQGDRHAGTMRLTRRLLVWPFAWRHELRLDDLRAIHVLAHTLRTEKHVVTSYALRLQTTGQNADEAVSLTFLPLFTAGPVTTLARMIRGWMQPRRVELLQHARGWPFR